MGLHFLKTNIAIENPIFADKYSTIKMVDFPWR